MKKSTLIILAVVAVVVVWAIGGYNGLVSADEKVSEQWANVETTYQRRADLIPNLVNTVKGYASHEQETLQAVTDARTRATSITIDPSTATAEDMERYMAAQQEVGSALGRLIAVSESYPELKANQNFLELQSQLEGTENRIAVARKNYNEAVKGYNTLVKQFPSNLVAKMFDFAERDLFSAAEGTEKAPQVEF